MVLPAASTRFLFVNGKGGVGKTSLSCACGVALAGAGRRVLIVCTDPASNLDEVRDAAQACHRELLRTQGDMPQAVTQLLPRLRDPEFTRVLIVTLPEATPVHEAGRLQRDLARAGIAPYAWVINQSLAASATRHPLPVQRGSYERAFIAGVTTQLARRSALVARQAQAPVGAHALRQLGV
jgi:arsenite-transporting ATPase